MKRLSVKAFLEKYITSGVPIYPSDFPASVDTCYVFEFEGSTSLRGSLSETHIVVYSRATSPDESERLSLDLLENLKSVTNEYIDGRQLVLVKRVGKHAEYGGKDESNRFYFSTRYRMLID